MAVIVPVTEMRNTTNFSKLCRNSNEPVFVTKNGYGDFVCMNMNLYEEIIGRIDTQKKILDGMDEMKKGKMIDGEKFMKEFLNKYGKKV